MKQNPLVMCLTNCVAADFTANALLAIGAKPAMIEEPSEAAELAEVADAVLVNLGTVHPRQAEAMRAAIAQISAPSRSRASVPTPWVLDPVACHLLSYRCRLAKEFIARRPSLIRGNHAEIDYLLANAGELTASVPILSTGEVDRIYPPSPCPPSPIAASPVPPFPSPTSVQPHPALRTPDACITGGVAMLQTVTATGCTQGAICAALLGRGLAPLAAAATASRMMKRAGELAWARAHTPGSFKVALIDALYDYNSHWQS